MPLIAFRWMATDGAAKVAERSWFLHSLVRLWFCSHLRRAWFAASDCAGHLLVHVKVRKITCWCVRFVVIRAYNAHTTFLAQQNFVRIVHACRNSRNRTHQSFGKYLESRSLWCMYASRYIAHDCQVHIKREPILQCCRVLTRWNCTKMCHVYAYAVWNWNNDCMCGPLRWTRFSQCLPRLSKQSLKRFLTAITGTFVGSHTILKHDSVCIFTYMSL